MFRNIIGCLLVIILGIRILHTSAISIAEQHAQNWEDILRQTKSAEMRKYLNETADPCEDFYEFTCGNYAKYKPTDTSTNYIQSLHSAMYGKVKKQLQLEDAADTDADKEMKMFYKSCTATPKLMTEYKDNLRELIAEYGSMPVLEGDSWQEDDFDWSTTVSQMIRSTGLSILFEIAVDSDFTDNSINRVTFYQPPFALADRYLYLDESMPGEREEYKAVVAKNLHKYLGVEEALAEQTAQEILDFEIALAYGMDDSNLDLLASEVYSLETIEEVQRKYLPVWDTRTFIDDTMDFTPSKLMVQHKYLENAYEVLKSTPRRIVANYIFYDYISYFFVFDADETPGEMEKFCLTLTKNYFYEQLMNLIYRKYFNDNMKAGVLFIWQELKIAFENLLQSPRLNWMSEDSRKAAAEKLEAMQLEILSYEQQNLSTDYKELQLNSHDYTHNLRAIRKVMGKQARSRFYEPARRLLEPISSVENYLSENTIKVPIDVLQLFSAGSGASYPYAYHFATLGYDIAHEIILGFENRGRYYDAQGNYDDWWSPRTAREFRKRQKCFVEQYKSFSYGRRTLPEQLVKSETIADNGGVHLAYAAYLNWYEKNVGNKRTQAESLPELNYTNRQLFFISYGQVWCSPTNTGATHNLEKFRVIGPLTNFEEFAQEFNCAEGSAMNPVKKCEIY